MESRIQSEVSDFALTIGHNVKESFAVRGESELSHNGETDLNESSLMEQTYFKKPKEVIAEDEDEDPFLLP